MKRTIWIVTSPWCDRIDYYAASGSRRTLAINDFLKNWTKPKSWRQYKREGWRCVRATVSWR